MTRTEKCKVIRDALRSVLPNSVFHYIASTKHGDEYIVWAEEESADLKADDRSVEVAMTGTIDLFTKTEYSPRIDAIEAALANAGVSYSINSVQYETDTNFIHYEWLWSY